MPRTLCCGLFLMLVAGVASAQTTPVSSGAAATNRSTAPGQAGPHQPRGSSGS